MRCMELTEALVTEDITPFERERLREALEEEVRRQLPTDRRLTRVVDWDPGCGHAVENAPGMRNTGSRTRRNPAVSRPNGSSRSIASALSASPGAWSPRPRRPSHAPRRRPVRHASRSRRCTARTRIPFMAAQLVETALDQAEGDRLSGRLGALEHVDGDQLGGLLHAHLVSVPREVKYQLRQLCNLKGT